MFVAFILGIPVFFQVGFVLLIPLVFTIARRTGLSLIKIGIPLVAGLSVVHGMLPPHPAAMLAVSAFNADVGRTILYGLLVGLPTAALAGPIYGAWMSRRIVLPAENPMAHSCPNGTVDASASPDMPELRDLALYGARPGDPHAARDRGGQLARPAEHSARGAAFHRQSDRGAAARAALLVLVARRRATFHA